MRLRTITSLLLVATAGLAAGCGSDEENGVGIPAASAEELQSRLVEVRNRLDAGLAGACDDIANDSRPAVEEIIQALPDDVDPDVRDALQQGFNRLFALSEEQCQGEEEPQTETTTTEEPTETTETAPPPTETAPPTTETEAPPPDTGEQPTEPNPPEGPGPGQGDGGPGGGGGGGVGPGGAG